MREHVEPTLEIAKARREQVLGELLGKLYCEGIPMSRSDRYDKKHIQQIAVRYLDGADIGLPRSGDHTNAIERTLREITPEQRHEIPGAVMAIVVSESMYRPQSLLGEPEKQELFIRADYALMHAEQQEGRGGFQRFRDDLEYRARLMLIAQSHDGTTPTDVYEANYRRYCSMVEPGAVRMFNPWKESRPTEETKQLEEKASLLRRFGRHLIGGLAGLALMGGPISLGPEHQVQEDDTDDEEPNDPLRP